MGADLKKDETAEKYCTLSGVSRMGGYREGGV